MVEESQVIGPPRLPALTSAERRDLMLYHALRRLPVPLVSRAGALLGHSLGRRSHPAAAARVAASLMRLFPALAADPAAAEAAQRRFWENVGRVYAEFCVLDRISASGRVTVEREAALTAVIQSERPVIITYVHLGNWEACGMDLASRAPGRISAFAAPLPANRARAQVAALQRGRSPGRVITTDRMAWRHALDRLEEPGGIFYVAIDEVAHGNVSVPSFGRPLDARGNLSKVVRLAARTGAIIQPLYSERLPGARFRTRLLEPIEFTTGTVLDGSMLQRCATQLERQYAPVVLDLAEQWFGLLDLQP